MTVKEDGIDGWHGVTPSEVREEFTTEDLSDAAAVRDGGKRYGVRQEFEMRWGEKILGYSEIPRLRVLQQEMEVRGGRTFLVRAFSISSISLK